jgi:DNA-binding transcriptional MerR regulator
MDEVRSGLRRLLETEDRPERQEQIKRLIAQTGTQMDDADELLRAGSGQPPDRAFRLAAGQTALTGDVEDAQQDAEDEQEAEDGKESIWDKIKRWLKRAGRKLWAMISRLVTVKEWSLTGTAGTSVLGLAQASISVTFGASPG